MTRSASPSAVGQRLVELVPFSWTELGRILSRRWLVQISEAYSTTDVTSLEGLQSAGSRSALYPDAFAIFIDVGRVAGSWEPAGLQEVSPATEPTDQLTSARSRACTKE